MADPKPPPAHTVLPDPDAVRNALAAVGLTLTGYHHGVRTPNPGSMPFEPLTRVEDRDG